NSVFSANPTIAGTIADGLSGLVSLTAQLDDGAASPVSVAPTTGAFSFPTVLKTDGTDDGPHAVALARTGVGGHVTNNRIDCPLATMPPPQPVFALAATDRQNGGSLGTTGAQVTLIGQTGANVRLEIVETGATALSTNTGAFQFPGVSLALGDN